MIDILAPYRDILDNLNEGVYYVDKDRKITYWNEAAEIITGYKAFEVVGAHCYGNILQHVDDFGKKLCILGCPLHDTIQSGVRSEANVYLHHKMGFRVPVFVRCLPIRAEDGTINGAIEIFSSSSDRESVLKRIDELEKLAMTDLLTGVANRRFMEKHIELSIREYNTISRGFGLLFIDIDNFKSVNDTYGHGVGDEVLKIVASTFKNNLRSGDMVARYGGEEFIISIPFVDKSRFAVTAEKLRMLVEMSDIRVGDTTFGVTVSIGAAIVRDDDDIDSLIKRADELMYESKKSGKNRVTVQSI